MATYIWSDLHLGHKNIIGYCNRPFTSVEEMNDRLIKAWQARVKKQDVIINLGDVCMGGGYNKEKLTALIPTLPGRKILVMGNHDRAHSANFWRDVGFDEVYPYPIIYRDWYILSHEPLFLNEKIPYLNVHGHTHEKSYDHPSYKNVSVDKTNFEPVDFEVIVKLGMQEQHPTEEIKC